MHRDALNQTYMPEREETVCETNSSVAISVPAASLRQLLELLELAARRGAFELEEFRAIGGIYAEVQQWIKRAEA